jgi:hypothetical protein
MLGATSCDDAGPMILSPEEFVPVEMSRHYAAAEALSAIPRRPRKARRGLVVRLVSMTVGRTAHV